MIKENTDTTAQNDDERFDSDMALMTGEVSQLLADLVAALGSEVTEQKDLVTENAKAA